jgi:uncharacterized protein
MRKQLMTWRSLPISLGPKLSFALAFCVVTLLIMGCPLLAAPSFDCSKASTPVEIVICSNPSLANLDSEMASVYSAAIKSNQSYGTAIRDNQRTWLKTRNKGCASTNHSVDCLAQLYQERIAELNSLLTSTGKASPPSQRGGPSVGSLVGAYQHFDHKTEDPTWVDLSLKGNAASVTASCSVSVPSTFGMTAHTCEFTGQATVQELEGALSSNEPVYFVDPGDNNVYMKLSFSQGGIWLLEFGSRDEINHPTSYYCGTSAYFKTDIFLNKSR